ASCRHHVRSGDPRERKVCGGEELRRGDRPAARRCRAAPSDARHCHNQRHRPQPEDHRRRDRAMPPGTTQASGGPLPHAVAGWRTHDEDSTAAHGSGAAVASLSLIGMQLWRLLRERAWLSLVLGATLLSSAVSREVGAQRRRVTIANSSGYAARIDTTFAFSKTGTVSLGAASGEVVVTGWSRAEIHVRAISDGDKLRVRGPTT